MSRPDQITCLRCRCCKLLPESHLRSPAAVVFCEKKQERSPLILSGCGLADPNLKYRGSSSSVVLLNGDKLRNASEVEIEYLRIHYPRAPWRKLEAVTGRHRLTLRSMAMRHGWKRDEEAVQLARGVCASSAASGRQRMGQTFNERQRECIANFFLTGFWPSRGGSMHLHIQAANNKVKAAIVATVAELDEHGKVWPWQSIQKHTRWTSPGYKRWDEKRRTERKKQRRVAELAS